MVFQHAALEIARISPELFGVVSQFVRDYLHQPSRSVESRCAQLSYDRDYLHRWTRETQYLEDTREIRNDCTVYAHPSLFEPLLRSLILDLAKEFPQAEFQGRFSLFHSNWGYSHYPFSFTRGALCWTEPQLARQQPEARRFWDTMAQAGITTIEDLFSQMYVPLTGNQRLDAFVILDSITDSSQDEITPWDGYGFDEEGFPEPESLTDFTYMIFLRHGWKEYGDIWGYLHDLTKRYTEAGIPIFLPSPFSEALKI